MIYLSNKLEDYFLIEDYIDKQHLSLQLLSSLNNSNLQIEKQINELKDNENR